MKAARILAIVLGGLLGMFVLLLLSVWLFVNPNTYKPRIVAGVKAATGRDLRLPGDIKLSVFPWVALELGPASLGNPPGFGEQPLVSIQHASVRVKLLPLLSKQLQVGEVQIDGLDLRLLKNAAGKGNWEGFGSTGDSRGQVGSAGRSRENLQGIDGLKLTKARLSYGQFTLENVNLDMAAFTDKRLVPAALHIEANRGVAGEHVTLDAKLKFSIDSGAQRYHVADLTLDAAANRAGSPPPVVLKLSAPALDVDLLAQTLSAPALSAQIAGAQIGASVQGTQLLDAMQLNGHFTLALMALHDVLSQLGVATPATRDPKALSSLAVTGDYAYGQNALHLEKLQATLDQTQLQGRIAVTDLDTDALSFALDADKIELDRYLPPSTSAGESKSAPVPAIASSDSKPLLAEGTVRVGELRLPPLDLTHVEVTLAARDQLVHLFPLKAQLFGGQYAGDVTLDDRGAVPSLSMNEHLSGVDVGRLAAVATQKLHVSGHGNINIKATGHGAGAAAILRTLDGQFDTNVADGAVEGVDLGYEIERAEALLHRQAPATGQSTKRTRFNSMRMSAQLQSGVATTRDLLIDSSALKITGQGSANLVSESIDFSLLADLLRSAGTTAMRIPMKVTGTMAAPTVRPDLEAFAKGQLQQKVQDALKGKLPDKLPGALKGLFGKP